MKIIQVTPYFHPHIGGVESHVLDLSRYLVKKGHEIVVLTSRYEKTLKSEEEMEGIRVRRLKTAFIAFSTPVFPEIKKEVVKEGGDIVHSHSPPPLSSYYAGKGAKKAGIPHVLTYHCDLEIPFPGGRQIVNLYRKTLGKATLKRTDRLIATTESYAATSRDIWKKEASVIPNAVDERIFTPELSGERIREKYGIEGNMVLYVGRLVFHKGIEYLIESAKYVDATYIIVGSGDKEAELKRFAARRGVRKKVIFAGRVDGRELPEYYAATDVFVLPSVSRLEAFGIVALEAMASGKPVIVSDIPGVNEVIEEGVQGIRAKPMDSKDIAEKINVLLRDEGIRKRMGSAGRKLVEERYTWKKVVEKIEAVYSEVVEGA